MKKIFVVCLMGGVVIQVHAMFVTSPILGRKAIINRDVQPKINVYKKLPQQNSFIEKEQSQDPNPTEYTKEEKAFIKERINHWHYELTNIYGTNRFVEDLIKKFAEADLMRRNWENSNGQNKKG